MKNVKKNLVISENTTIIEAMSLIDKGGQGIAFVCDDQNVLLATISDGDIRRYIIYNGDLSGFVRDIANYQFEFILFSQKHLAKELIQKKRIRCLPILDEKGHLLSAYFWDKTELIQKMELLNLPVVIQAGGKGTRLYPYTKILPKPLVPIGDETITEHIISRFLQYDCHTFFMIVNHKKSMVKAYFSDIETPYHMEFIDEDSPLGTGGGLSLLKGKIKSTFFLSNCDVLIDDDYYQMYKMHQSNKNAVTIICAVKQTTIPYGAIDVNDLGEVVAMHEKPTYSYMANTGLYIFEPSILDYIPDNTFIHITDVIQSCLDHGQKVGIYPVSEDQWSDMGQLNELEKMRNKLDSI